MWKISQGLEKNMSSDKSLKVVRIELIAYRIEIEWLEYELNKTASYKYLQLEKSQISVQVVFLFLDLILNVLFEERNVIRVIS